MQCLTVDGDDDDGALGGGDEARAAVLAAHSGLVSAAVNCTAVPPRSVLLLQNLEPDCCFTCTARDARQVVQAEKRRRLTPEHHRQLAACFQRERGGRDVEKQAVLVHRRRAPLHAGLARRHGIQRSVAPDLAPVQRLRGLPAPGGPGGRVNVGDAGKFGHAEDAIVPEQLPEARHPGRRAQSQRGSMQAGGRSGEAEI